MTVGEAERYLKAKGIQFSTLKSTGHQRITNPANGKETIFPMHSRKRELATGTWHKILKDLGLK